MRILVISLTFFITTSCFGSDWSTLSGSQQSALTVLDKYVKSFSATSSEPCIGYSPTLGTPLSPEYQQEIRFTPSDDSNKLACLMAVGGFLMSGVKILTTVASSVTATTQAVNTVDETINGRKKIEAKKKKLAAKQAQAKIEKDALDNMTTFQLRIMSEHEANGNDGKTYWQNRLLDRLMQDDAGSELNSSDDYEQDAIIND